MRNISMMGTMLIAASLLALGPVGAMAQSAPAQDDATAAFEADLFGSSSYPSGTSQQDTQATEGSVSVNLAPANVARTEYLVGGTVVALASSSFTTDMDELAAKSTIAGKLFAKVSVPDYGQLYVAYNASFPFFQSYSGDGTSPPVLDPSSPDYTLAELHYSFDLSKILFVRIGEQLIAWGPSRIWSPVDFINLEKADAFASLDLRVGKPGLRLHLPLPNSNAFLFTDFSGLVTDDGSLWTAGDPLETVKVGGRFDFTAGPFEYGLSAYGGKNIQLGLGLDASGRLFGTTVYGELALRPGYSSYSYSTQASLGFSRALGELKRWTLSAEGFYNSLGRDLGGYTAANIMSLPADERIPLYQGAYYAYAALQADELLSSSLSTTLSVISNLSDASFSVKLAESFSFPRAVPFTFSVSYMGGGADREFTRYTGGNAFTVSASTRVEF